MQRLMGQGRGGHGACSCRLETSTCLWVVGATGGGQGLEERNEGHVFRGFQLVEGWEAPWTLCRQDWRRVGGRRVTSDGNPEGGTQQEAKSSGCAGEAPSLGVPTVSGTGSCFTSMTLLDPQIVLGRECDVPIFRMRKQRLQKSVQSQVSSLRALNSPLAHQGQPGCGG